MEEAALSRDLGIAPYIFYDYVFYYSPFKIPGCFICDANRVLAGGQEEKIPVIFVSPSPPPLILRKRYNQKKIFCIKVIFHVVADLIYEPNNFSEAT